MMEEGKKEQEGKLAYEFDWEFIEEMAKRMQVNKGKYAPYNWKLPLPSDKLMDACTRHLVAIRKGEFKDGGQEYGHLAALACNAMMLYYQLKNNEHDNKKL